MWTNSCPFEGPGCKKHLGTDKKTPSNSVREAPLKLRSHSVSDQTSHGRTESSPTSAVLGGDGVAVETGGTPLAVGTSGVAPAVLAVARHVVALVEDQVGVRVAVTLAPLTGAADDHWVAVVTGGTPAGGSNYRLL